jgi:hypothetical protein
MQLRNHKTPLTLQFNDVAFTYMVPRRAGVGSSPVQAWSFQLDLISLSESSGLMIGLGKFLHETDCPGYRLIASTAQRPR